jgi:hypothetical protein
MRISMRVAVTRNTIVVIEDPATEQSDHSEPFSMGTAPAIQCVCGARIHPIIGALCPKCCAMVVQIREFQ